MTLWQRILQGLTAFSLSTLIGTGAGVIAAMLVFRILTPDLYGQLALFLSFYATGETFLSFGLGSIFTAEVARARGGEQYDWARYLITRYFRLLLVTGSALLIIFLAIGAWSQNQTMWAIMGAYLWLSAPNYGSRVLFHAGTRFRRLALQSVSRSVGRLLLLLTFSWWWPGDPLTGVALTYPLVELATLLLSLLLAKTAWREFSDADASHYDYRTLLRLLRKQGIYDSLGLITKTIADQLPIWFLTRLAGDAAVGIYAAAQKAFQLGYTFFATLEQTLFPLVSEQLESDSERLRIALFQTQKYTFWLSLALLLSGIIAAPWIIVLIAGPSYQTAVPVFQILLLLLLANAIGQTQRPVLYAAGQQKWLFYTHLAVSAVTIPLLATAVFLWQAAGAASMLVTRNTLIIAWRKRLIHRLTPHLITPLRHLFRIDPFDRRLWQTLKNRLKIL